MKQIILFPILLLAANICFAQPTTVTSANGPFGMVKAGNDLYYSEFADGKISKIDLSSGTPTPVDVVTGLSGPCGLALFGNFLFIAELSADKISKVDIVSGPATATDVITGLNDPFDLKIIGFDLFITETGGDKISKIDATSGSPTAVDVITGINSPSHFAQNGADLYCSIYGDNKIIKFDHASATPTATDVITGLTDPVGIAFKNNDLLIAESTNVISKADITDASPVLIPIENSGLNNPQNLLVDGNDLFIADNLNMRIALADLTSIGFDENQQIELSIYPNPATEHLRITGFKGSQNYSIIDMAGATVLTGIITDQTAIQLVGLKAGQYIIQLEKNQQLSFVKQ